MESEQWGRRIRAFRKLKGYTQVQLAKELGISLSLLGEVERDSRKPTAEFIERVCGQLDISVDEMKRL
ncbi:MULTISPECIES: helix-turn-helix domain-containing protein [unclassified Sporolactobacillus]|uniref:helix-turn-helix domain-containing protein n=1 Tax=unclassified Sporolactobacillus TaxID=2628533 RepID=UPI0023684D24|nr:helix-turn-helix transcriptional regulator [Sporolactobacillus sp. CQH2019]MDD9150715.1 helix-turn-helix transcriptional regulator [Sporolactobacillus sp. CQH2019]